MEKIIETSIAIDQAIKAITDLSKLTEVQLSEMVAADKQNLINLLEGVIDTLKA